MKPAPLALPCALLLSLVPAGLAPAAPPPAGAGSHPVVAVETTYPGANAAVVADTVAAPIEQQVNGALDLAHTVSRCTDDGRYALLLSFDSNTNFDLRQVLVQNRVSLAEPALPEAVRRGGVTTRKVVPGAPLIVALFSPDGKRDAAYLGNYAALHIKDEVARVAGVAQVSPLGGDELGVIVTLDREKLAALNLTAADVLRALREQGLREKTKPADWPGKTGDATQLRLDTGGHATDAETLAAVVVKATAGNGVVLLRDVARVELASAPSGGGATLDGRPAVALAVALLPSAKPAEVSAAVRERMQRLSKAFPEGVDSSLPLDLTAKGAGKSGPPWCLLAEPVLPSGASAGRALECRATYSDLLRKTEGVRHVLSLPENPFALFRGGPCVVAVFGPDTKEADWQRTRQDVRDRLSREVRSADVRLRDLSGPGGVRLDGYPVDFALRGDDDKSVRQFAEKLAERLAKTRKLTDVSAGPKVTPQLSIDIDRDRAATLGVRPADVNDVLQVVFGSAVVEDDNRSARTHRARVRIDDRSRDLAADVKKLQVRSAKGEMVPLASVATVKEFDGPASVDRVDLRPAALVSGNPAPGVSLAEARWLCETLAEQVRKDLRLSAESGLVWLQPVPTAKPIPGEPKAGPEPAPPEVIVAPPVSREVTDSEDFTGRIDASQSVDLRARVTGYLEKVAFKDGAEVKKGDVLFVIDARPYQTALDKAQADLKAAEAQRDAAKRTLERLRAGGSTPQADIDAADANARAEAAKVEAVKAAVETAKLNLDYTTIRAPFDGRIGRRLADPGSLVVADETKLANLVSVGAVYVYFEADERTVLRLARDGKGKALADADVPVSVGLSDEKGYPLRGTLDFVDNRANPDTGTLTLRATLPNKDGSLRPGLFARVRLPIGAPHKALLVPEEAIIANEGRKFVYVVDKDNKVVLRTVSLGGKHDDLRVITQGIGPDDRVMTERLSPVRPGDTVRPVAAKP